MNYIVLYKGDSQVYGAGSKAVALSSPPPDGFTIADKVVLFVTQEPDSEELIVRPIPADEVMSAEIQWPKKKGEEEAVSP